MYLFCCSNASSSDRVNHTPIYAKTKVPEFTVFTYNLELYNSQHQFYLLYCFSDKMFTSIKNSLYFLPLYIFEKEILWRLALSEKAIISGMSSNVCSTYSKGWSIVIKLPIEGWVWMGKTEYLPIVKTILHIYQRCLLKIFLEMGKIYVKITVCSWNGNILTDLSVIIKMLS